MILFHFVGEIIGGSLKIVESEIIDSNWISIHKLMQFENNELRNASVLKQITEAILHQKFYPLTCFNKQIII